MSRLAALPGSSMMTSHWLKVLQRQGLHDYPHRCRPLFDELLQSHEDVNKRLTPSIVSLQSLDAAVNYI